MKLVRTSILAVFYAAFLLLPACGDGGDEGPTDPDGGDPPTLNLATVDLQVDEDQAHTADLSGIVTNGTLQGVSVAEGSSLVSVSLEGSTLHITPASDQHGSFTLEFSASNSDGTTSRQRSGSVQPWTDIPAGQLQDNETDTGAPGEIRLHSVSDDSLIETISTDAEGNYESVQNITDGDLVVQAALTDGDNMSSYIRTLRTENGQDLKTSVIRAVPYPIQLVTKQGFQTHIQDVTDVNNHKIIKYQIEDINGAYIIKSDQEADLVDEFTQSQQEKIKQTWTEKENLPKVMEGQVLDVIVGTEDDQNRPYTLGSQGEVIPNDGWVIIAPKGPGGNLGVPTDKEGDGIIDYSNVLIDSRVTEDGLQRISNHEGIHAVLGIGHSNLSNNITIMASSVSRQTPSYVDEKTGYLLLEETYPPYHQ